MALPGKNGTHPLVSVLVVAGSSLTGDALEVLLTGESGLRVSRLPTLRLDTLRDHVVETQPAVVVIEENEPREWLRAVINLPQLFIGLRAIVVSFENDVAQVYRSDRLALSDASDLVTCILMLAYQSSFSGKGGISWSNLDA